ncbi:HAMP domain-containing protein [Herbaspirillum sp. HC18]|nr:HAMP domain-containing protein [Herbaspirillum sp. HC18]
MKLHNIRVSTRMWLSVYALLLSLITVIGIVGWRSISLQERTDTLTAQTEAKVLAASRWSSLAERVVARTKASLIATGPEVADAFRDVVKSEQAQITELQKSLETMALSDYDRSQMDKIADERKLAVKHLAAVNQLKASGDTAGARAIFDNDFTPAINVYLQTLRDFVRHQEDNAKKVREDLAQEHHTTMKLSAAAILLIVITALGGSAWMIHSIRQPLVDAVGLANRIAQGDLTTHPETTRGDELGDMIRALKRMNDALSDVVGQVRHSAESVVSAAGEIAAGNMDLSSRTEQQASSLEETASSMEELTSTVKQNADNARRASRMAESASDVAAQGGALVSEVVETMAAIDASSKKISDIIGVIDGIAFQTNILALNAAVEAARAGEQGRGFAVVASEVRNLAQRSAAAAKEIKTLIGDSAEKVDVGAQLVNKAGATMEEIVSSVKHVADIMGEITSASEEQAAGIEQVNQAISHMDHATQQNAALVEEAAAASQAMQGQAGNLIEAVRVFKLDGETHASLVVASNDGDAALRIAPLSNVLPLKGSRQHAAHQLEFDAAGLPPPKVARLS